MAAFFERGRHRNYANCGSVLACSGLTARGRASRRAGSGRRRMARRDSGDVYVRAGRVLRPWTRSIAFVSLREHGASDLNGIAQVVFVVGCCERAPSRCSLSWTRSRWNGDDCRGVIGGEYLIFQRVFACFHHLAENCARTSGVAESGRMGKRKIGDKAQLYHSKAFKVVYNYLWSFYIPK